MVVCELLNLADFLSIIIHINPYFYTKSLTIFYKSSISLPLSRYGTQRKLSFTHQCQYGITLSENKVVKEFEKKSSRVFSVYILPFGGIY